MSLVESSAAFFQRCDEISPDGALKAALDAQEIKTHSAMAFTMGTQMTRPMNSSTGWHKECLEAAPNVGQISSIRRMHFESTTLVISTIREKVTSDGAEKGDAVGRWTTW